VTEDVLDLDDQLSRPPGLPRGGYDEAELVGLLRREHGFQPGLVFVREFASDDADISIHVWWNYTDVVADPDGRSDGDDHEAACAELSAFWMRGERFVVDRGRPFRVGPDGVSEPD
jgi:hypothetical protein